MIEKNILKRQYKFFVTICIVVGFVVGTGIFWQPPTVYRYVDGNIWMGVLAWLVGGMAIATCVYMFSVLARKYEHVHGMVDYAEAAVGKRFGYLCGWFFAIMYQTAGYAIIAWITASFTAALAGHEATRNTPFVFFLTAFYMVITFVLNYLAPKLPIRFNSTTTVLRVIPLLLMGTVGVVIAHIAGDGWGYSQAVSGIVSGNVTRAGFMGAVFATAFAYNGWQAAVAFNSEVNDSKRKFPVALLLGFFLVMVIYILYFIGVVSAADPYALMNPALNQVATRAAFANIFGYHASYIIMIFVIISGLGILNMCCMGMSRGLYSLARRGRGPISNRMVQLDPQTGVPVCSMVTCVGVSFLWLTVIYGNYNGWYSLPNGEPFWFFLPDFYNMIFFILQIPIFIGFMARNFKEKSIHWFNRFFAPLIAIGGAGFMTYALVQRSREHAVVYLIIFAVLTVFGGFFYGKRK
ncbi:MAG: APC family permease [Firmicutes bacterium]|nr:APC family permease [Bacillota bacterium]